MLFKGSLFTKDYTNTLNELINHLIATIYAINDKEHVLYVLEGLDLNYTSLIILITSKKFLPSLDEVFSKIKIHEC